MKEEMKEIEKLKIQLSIAEKALRHYTQWYSSGPSTAFYALEQIEKFTHPKLDDDQYLDILLGVAEEKRWKDKYTITWCDTCEVAIIYCPDCHNSSCNASGCEKCHDDFVEFHVLKHSVSSYLIEEEKKVYKKIFWIKKYILESFRAGEKEINWNKLKEDGHLCTASEKMFEKEISESEKQFYKECNTVMDKVIEKLPEDLGDWREP